ncbi:MAG: glutaredoxin family protein [Nitriliruptorales bacterium]|nr:glutaredoxin family protein [Nitriliruptorales bacterium]
MVAAVAAVTASLVSGVFTLRLVARARRGGPGAAAMRAWAAALGMFFVASAAMAVGTLGSWSTATFRVFYLFGAVLNVVWLAHGSALANAARRVTSRVVGGVMLVAVLVLIRFAIDDPALYGPSLVVGTAWALAHLPGSERALVVAESVVVWVFTAVAVPVVLTADLVAVVPLEGLPEGRDLFAPAVRGLAVAGSSFGALAVIVGAIASSAEQVWRWPDRSAGESLREHLGQTARRGLVGWVDVVADWVFAGRRGIDLAGRVRGNLLIALGVLVAAAGGIFSFLGDTTGHAVGLSLGVIIMFAGFLGAVAPAASAAAAAVRQEAAGGAWAEDPTVGTTSVTVYTRRGCSLCEAAERLAATEADTVILVDVDEDPLLQDRFGTRVPVIEVAGSIVAEGVVQPGDIASALASSGRVGA